MLKAAHLFRDTTREGLIGGDSVAAPSCRFLQISRYSWRLERDHADISVQASNINTNSKNYGNNQSVMASMAHLLTQQSKLKEEQQQQQKPKEDTANDGEENRWVQDMESFLSLHNNGRGNDEKIQTNAGRDVALAVYEDRNGVILSSPLRLSQKTLTKSLLQPTAVAEDSSPGEGGEAIPFCLRSLTHGGERTGTMEFSLYHRGHQSQATRSNIPGEDEVQYVPSGYEELEEEGVSIQQQQNDTSFIPSPVYYIMELRNTKRDSFPVLEDIAIVWDDKDDKNTIIHTKASLGARGLQIKLLSATAFQEIVAQNQEAAESTAGLFDGLLFDLANAPALSLPQPVPSSMMMVVSFSSEDEAAGVDIIDKQKRLMAQLERSVRTGHVLLRFHRSELVRHPLSSHVSLAHFCIGRRVQIITNNSESEEEAAIKLLEAALIHAERFVPAWKQQQWDSVPDALIVVAPHPGLPYNIQDWLLDPTMRRSSFDLSLFNLLLYQNYAATLTPPVCHYVDKYTMLGGHVWNDICFVRHSIVQKVEQVRANASTIEQQWRLRTSTGVDARALREMCSNMQHLTLPLEMTYQIYICDMVQKYIERMLVTLEIEQLRCFEDMKKHDMYSILWNRNQIQIPAPLVPRLGCIKCAPGTQSRDFDGVLCPYHLAAINGGIEATNGKPVSIVTKQQLEALPRILSLMNYGTLHLAVASHAVYTTLTSVSHHILFC